MGGGTGGGTSGTDSISKPLTPDERQALYTAGYSMLNPTMPGNSYTTPTYQSADIYDSGAAERMGAGDYNQLEKSILQSRTAPLNEAYGLALQQNDADMAKRGIWSSGAATKGQLDTQAKFGTLLNQAAGEASAQRYGLQSQDINAYNQYNLGRAGQLNTASSTGAGMANQFNLQNAAAKQASAWQPANYYKDIWNGSGGTVSTSSGGGGNSGWNFMI